MDGVGKRVPGSSVKMEQVLSGHIYNCCLCFTTPLRVGEVTKIVCHSEETLFIGSDSEQTVQVQL